MELLLDLEGVDDQHCVLKLRLAISAKLYGQEELCIWWEEVGELLIKSNAPLVMVETKTSVHHFNGNHASFCYLLVVDLLRLVVRWHVEGIVNQTKVHQMIGISSLVYRIFI